VNFLNLRKNIKKQRLPSGKPTAEANSRETENIAHR